MFDRQGFDLGVRGPFSVGYLILFSISNPVACPDKISLLRDFQDLIMDLL